jgi:Fic family protein
MRRSKRFWELHANDVFNERQRSIISKLLDGFEGKMTSSKWARAAECSQDSALRDIDDLLKRGILVKEPGGGRSTSYVLAGFAREDFPEPTECASKTKRSRKRVA